jgi:hypothetical protein
MSEGYKPCPFCGGPAERQEWREEGGGMRFAVWCADIYCVSRRNYGTPQEAAECWNRRDWMPNA